MIEYYISQCLFQLKPNNSTSNFKVELGGMIGGYPYLP